MLFICEFPISRLSFAFFKWDSLSSLVYFAFLRFSIPEIYSLRVKIDLEKRVNLCATLYFIKVLRTGKCLILEFELS